MKGEGKSWAKGRTAANDPRIARNAERHRGMLYVRRTARTECRWTLASTRTLPLEWSESMAYVVGLTATDGCLVTGRRAINFKSMDRDLVALYLRLLGRTNRIVASRTRIGNLAYHVQFGDTEWYEWLRSIGLSPRKSLTLGAIEVPDESLLPLVRGLLDGDGTIYVREGHPTPATRPDYVYERLWTKFTSASRPHLEWLGSRIRASLRLEGYLSEERRRPGRHPFFTLKYGNRASIELLPALYPYDGVPCLERKRAKWVAYASRHGLSAVKLDRSPT